MSKSRRTKKRRLITDLKAKLEYFKTPPLNKKGNIANIRDLCPYCSDKEKNIAVRVAWLKKDRGPKHKPRWENRVKECPKCERIYSKEKREVETF